MFNFSKAEETDKKFMGIADSPCDSMDNISGIGTHMRFGLDINVVDNGDIVLGTDRLFDLPGLINGIGIQNNNGSFKSNKVTVSKVPDDNITMNSSLEKKLIICTMKLYGTLHFVIMENVKADIIYYDSDDGDSRALVSLYFDSIKLGASKFGDRAAVIDSSKWIDCIIDTQPEYGALWDTKRIGRKSREEKPFKSNMASMFNTYGRRYVFKYMIDTSMDFDLEMRIDNDSAAFKDVIGKFIRLITCEDTSSRY